MVDGCVFCVLPAREPASYPHALILACSSLAFVILNRYPYNAGHLMVIPRNHVSDITMLSDVEYDAVSRLLRASVRIVKQQLGPDGVNIGMNLGKAAGAGIEEHCHFHIVPRWSGDTNFMPVLGNTKVVSEEMGAVYQKLLPSFHSLFETERFD